VSIDWTAADATVAAAVRARGVETDLADADLAAYARAAVDEIAGRGFGPQTDVVLNAVGTSQLLIALDPPASTVTEVIEDDITLDDDEDGYRLRPGGAFLERLDAGYQTGWSGLIAITYDAAPANDRYDRVVVDLVKLALQFSGLDSRRDGDHAEEAMGARSGGQEGYQSQRDSLISELAPAGISFA
jgi:hypothetical protein